MIVYFHCSECEQASLVSLKAPRCKCVPWVTSSQVLLGDNWFTSSHALSLLSQGMAVSTETGMSPNGLICHHSSLSPHPGTSHFPLALFLHCHCHCFSASYRTLSFNFLPLFLMPLGHWTRTHVTLMLELGNVLEIFWLLGVQTISRSTVNSLATILINRYKCLGHLSSKTLRFAAFFCFISL